MNDTLIIEDTTLLWELKIEESDSFSQMMTKILESKNIKWKDIPNITGISRTSVYEYQKGIHTPSVFTIAIMVYGLKIDFVTALALIKHSGYAITNTKECLLSLQIMQSVPYSEKDCAAVYKQCKKMLDK